MSRPVRVLQVLGGLGMGGAETWLMAVLRRWARDGTGQMDFLLTGGKPEQFDAEAAGLGAQLHYLRYGRANMVSFIPAYRRLLMEGHFDAIHDHSDYASGWRLALAAGLLPPVRVAHVHNPWLHIEANYAVSTSRKLASIGGRALVRKMATHVVGTSNEILRRYGFEPKRRKGPKVEVIHCGFDVGRFNAPRDTDRTRLLQEFGWAEDIKLILFAGRLDRALEFDHPQNHKNSWLALNIAREAAVISPAVRLIMAGDGPSREALAAQVREWGMADRLRLLGVRHDLPALMRAADALLFPSAQEGLGMVAVEAQAASLAVVASTAVPREAVVIPELYEALPLDAPLADWAQALLAAMARPRPLMAQCRRRLETSDFSIETSSRRLLEIYRGRG